MFMFTKTEIICYNIIYSKYSNIKTLLQFKITVEFLNIL